MKAFNYQPPKLRDYQQNAVDNICSNLSTDNTHIIAFCTGGGKTHTARTIIANLMSNYRCLVLTHNQTILRDNFADQFVDDDLVVDYKSPQDLLKAQRARVVIGIPAGLYKQIDKLGQFDYMIIDEAHQYIHKQCSMFTTIQRHLGKIPQILLTASHYGFNDDKYIKHLYAREQALVDGVISDVEVQLIRTDWHPRKDCFDQNENLKTSVSIPDVYGIEVCDEMALRIEHGDYLRKSIIACHNTHTANNIFEYFESRYPGQVLLSHSKNDYDATAFKDFQQCDDFRILVVVNRGIIGFDCPQLECIFDITLSKNVARIEQLLGRIIRKFDVEKTYYRIAPTVDLLNHSIVMNSVLALSIEENNREFDGTKTSLKIIFNPQDKAAILAEQAEALERLKERQPNLQPASYKQAGKKPLPKKKVVSLKTRPILKQSEYNDVFNKVSTGGSDVWELEGLTTLAEALGVDVTKKPNGYWNIYENCLEEAKKYKSASQFYKNNKSCYNKCIKNNFLDQITKDLGWKNVKPNGYWDIYENCLEEAKKYKTAGEFLKNSGGCYVMCIKNNFLNQITKDLGWKSTKTKGSWSVYENCLEEAKKYKTAGEFQKNNKSCYNRCLKNNFLDQIKKDLGWE